MKNKKRYLLIVSIVFTVFFAGAVLPVFSRNAAASQLPAASPAALIKSAGCTGCHIINGGGGTMGPNLSAIGSVLSADGIKGALYLMVGNGYASLTPAQISEAAAYLKTLKASAPAVVNGKSPSAVLQSAGCLGCHADTADGTGIAPNLYGIGGVLSAKGIETAVNDMSSNILASPLSPSEISSVSAYLESLKGNAGATPAVKKPYGLNMMASAGCLGCHTVTGTGITVGPDLSSAGSTLNPSGIGVIVRYMNDCMIAHPLSASAVSAVENYIEQKLNKRPPEYESADTPFKLTKETCLGCHTVNGVYGAAAGSNNGPAFNFSTFAGMGNAGWWWGAVNMNKKFFSRELTSAQISEILNYLSSRYVNK